MNLTTYDVQSDFLFQLLWLLSHCNLTAYELELFTCWKNQQRQQSWIRVLEFILCAEYPEFDVGLFVTISNHPILFCLEKMCVENLTGLPLSSNICSFMLTYLVDG